MLNVGDIQPREQVNAIGCFKNRELMLTPVNFYIANERRHNPTTPTTQRATRRVDFQELRRILRLYRHDHSADGVGFDKVFNFASKLAPGFKKAVECRLKDDRATDFKNLEEILHEAKIGNKLLAGFENPLPDSMIPVENPGADDPCGQS